MLCTPSTALHLTDVTGRETELYCMAVVSVAFVLASEAEPPGSAYAINLEAKVWVRPKPARTYSVRVGQTAASIPNSTTQNIKAKGPPGAPNLPSSVARYIRRYRTPTPHLATLLATIRGAVSAEAHCGSLIDQTGGRQPVTMSPSAPTNFRHPNAGRKRLGHRKSRNGCARCKKRRVKVCGPPLGTLICPTPLLPWRGFASSLM